MFLHKKNNLTSKTVSSSSVCIHLKKRGKRVLKWATSMRPTPFNRGSQCVSHAIRRCLFLGCLSKWFKISLNIFSYLYRSECQRTSKICQVLIAGEDIIIQWNMLKRYSTGILVRKGHPNNPFVRYN